CLRNFHASNNQPPRTPSARLHTLHAGLATSAVREQQGLVCRCADHDGWYAGHAVGITPAAGRRIAPQTKQGAHGGPAHGGTALACSALGRSSMAVRLVRG